MANNRRTGRVAAVLSSIAWIAVASSAVGAPNTTAPAPPQAVQSSAPVAPSQTPQLIRFDEYQAALTREREMLERQADRHFSAVNNALDRATSLFVWIVSAAVFVMAALVGIFLWLFGKTLKEFQDTVKERFETLTRETVEAEAENLR